jgi:hypothetical protein
VRFAGRAVSAGVEFGSRLTARMWRLANAKLATVHPRPARLVVESQNLLGDR